MKAYVTPNHLRLVGKAYEIRCCLRMLMDRAPNPYKPLAVSLSEISGQSARPSHSPKQHKQAHHVIPFLLT